MAGNLGDSIDSNAISALGNQCTGLSTGQLTMIKPQQLVIALSSLATVNGWNQGQADGIIQMLLSSGMVKVCICCLPFFMFAVFELPSGLSLFLLLQINSSSSLLSLGSLVMGTPSTMYSSISGTELLTASKNPSFVANILTAPQIVQYSFVTQV